MVSKLALVKRWLGRRSLIFWMLNTRHTIHTDKRRFAGIKIKVNHVPIIGVASNHRLADSFQRHKANALVWTNHLLVLEIRGAPWGF
jgi:hypothetical protein